jgi:hypothetical protein
MEVSVSEEISAIPESGPIEYLWINFKDNHLLRDLPPVAEHQNIEWVNVHPFLHHQRRNDANNFSQWHRRKVSVLLMGAQHDCHQLDIYWISIGTVKF